MSAHAQESFVQANGVRHHVVTWSGGERGTFLLCHGFLDFAFSFQGLAEHLAAEGYRVVAFDFRGHGHTGWVGAGGYYHFPDYVMDLEALLPQVARGPVHLVGHSMGGTVCTYYAGVRSERLTTLATIEGMGPPATRDEEAPGRMLTWFESVARVREKTARPMKDAAEALSRMRLTHPYLDDTLGLFLASKATRPRDDGEGLRWCFDPLHRTTSPIPFRKDALMAFARRIAVPTLLVAGERGLRLPDERERAEAIEGARLVEIPDAGHMLHWEQPPRPRGRAPGPRRAPRSVSAMTVSDATC